MITLSPAIISLKLNFVLISFRREVSDGLHPCGAQIGGEKNRKDAMTILHLTKAQMNNKGKIKENLPINAKESNYTSH